MVEILRTIHGSRLYGLQTSSSDEDWFVVDDEFKRNTTKYDGNLDIRQHSLESFLKLISNGSHQAMEALWSPYKTVDPRYAAMLDGIRVTSGEAFYKHERTIRKLCYMDFKHRRHSVRIWMNLYELRRHGRYNPVMTPAQKAIANGYARNLQDDDLARALDVWHA